MLRQVGKQVVGLGPGYEHRNATAQAGADEPRSDHARTGQSTVHQFVQLLVTALIPAGLADLYCLSVVQFFDFLAAALLDDSTCLHLYPTGATPDLFLDAASKAGRMLKVWRQSKTEDESP